MFVLMWLLFLFVDTYVPIILDPIGIKTYDGFAIRRSVRWQDVRRVQRFPFGPGVVVYFIDNGANLAFRPLIDNLIRDHREFFTAVEKFAGQEHPLTEFLRKEWQLG